MKTKINENVRMLNLAQAMEYSGLGRNSFLELAKQCQCARRFGRRVLYDVRRLDEGLDNLPIKEEVQNNN